MEGYLAVPPERGTILGRALWKTRYVIIGLAQRDVTGNAGASSPHVLPRSRSKGSVGTSRSLSSVSLDGATYLSIYKSPDELEAIQQWPVSSITQCQVQMAAHRKQGPVLPTLIVTLAPDPAADKLRKRRSSRAAALVASSRDAGQTCLWFRTEDPLQSNSLHEWAKCIHAVAQLNVSNNLPMSPMSPASPSFNSPFPTRHNSRDAADYYQPRPPSAPKTTVQHKASDTTRVSRERPVTFSDTPSLRSRRSDISSLTGVNLPPIVAQSYTSVLPSDLPSPATTATGEHFNGFIEGWTSAQGRSSTLSSPVRAGRDSMGSIPPFSPPPTIESGSPPFPRETILDRAFQLRYIPGSEQEIPGEEKLSSLARFEALMQQADEQKKLRQKRERATRLPTSPPQTSESEVKSAWDLDEDSDEDSDLGSEDVGSGSGIAQERDVRDDVEIMRPETRRGLDYVTGRVTPQSLSPRSDEGSRTPISYNPETLMALNSGSPHGLGSDSNRPAFAQRTHSQTQIAGIGSMKLSVSQQTFDASPAKSSTTSGKTSISNFEENAGGLNPAADLYRTSTMAEGQQRQPAAISGGGNCSGNGNGSGNGSGNCNGKRLSFTEFTRRLSSASSLLLPIQTNTSRNDETAVAEAQPHGTPSVFSSPRMEREKDYDPEPCDQKCSSWRSLGSVGVFGSEGGFL